LFVAFLNCRSSHQWQGLANKGEKEDNDFARCHFFGCEDLLSRRAKAHGIEISRSFFGLFLLQEGSLW